MGKRMVEKRMMVASWGEARRAEYVKTAGGSEWFSAEVQRCLCASIYALSTEFLPHPHKT